MNKTQVLAQKEVIYPVTNTLCRVIGVDKSNPDRVIIYHFGEMSVNPENLKPAN